MSSLYSGLLGVCVHVYFTVRGAVHPTVLLVYLSSSELQGMKFTLQYTLLKFSPRIMLKSKFTYTFTKSITSYYIFHNVYTQFIFTYCKPNNQVMLKVHCNLMTARLHRCNHFTLGREEKVANIFLNTSLQPFSTNTQTNDS